MPPVQGSIQHSEVVAAVLLDQVQERFLEPAKKALK
jgi:hypothetical protein